MSTPQQFQDISLLTKGYLTFRLLRTLARRTVWPAISHSVKVPGNSKFMSASEAVQLLTDGMVVALPAFAGNKHASTLYTALATRYNQTKKPANLTLICPAGMGSRGKAKGSVEDIGLPGLCTRLFTGHAETHKAQLRLTDQKKCELQVFPQGALLLIYGEQARNGKNSVTVGVGEGTFLDPRVGRGTRFHPSGEQFVRVEDDGKFTYSLPPITAVLFNAPAADKKGNIYVKGTAVLSEDLEAAQAAKRNGGVVIVQVGLLVEENYGPIYIPSSLVDAIVVHPYTEQTIAAPYSSPFPFLTLDYDRNGRQHEGVAKIHTLNRVLKATPVRKDIDKAMARLGAAILVDNITKGAAIDIGTGLPEEVAKVFYEHGLHEQVTLFNESGVLGGALCPGAYFGTSVHPKEIISSVEVWQRVYAHLDVIIVGALEVDSRGNVNVSKRGHGAINYVGPGGFIDLTTNAKICVFCCAWMAGGDITVVGDHVKLKKKGKPKFIPKVDEVTFYADTARKQGKKVFYITPIGAFQLVPDGIELIALMPGIDLKKDVLDFATASILSPQGKPYLTKVPYVTASIVTGKGYKLTLRDSGSPPPASLLWPKAKL